MSEVRRQAALLQRPNWGWQDEAACRGREVVLFFGPDGERQPEREIRERKAKAVCAACPVRAECLSYAVSRPEKYGTWGGLNEEERSSERRRRMRRANAAGVVSAGDCHGLCQLPGSASFGLPRRELVRLPAPAASQAD